jgi:O-antigen ligase
MAMLYTRFPLKARGGALLAGELPEISAQDSVEQSLAPVEVAPVRLKAIPTILMLSIVIPIIVNLGGLALTPSRMVLVLTIIPVFFFWMTGKAGRIRIADIMVMSCVAWTVIALLAVEGLARFQYAAVVAIEMLGPYLIARCYIRGEADYAALIRFLRWIAIFLAPAAMIEALTTRRPYVMLLDPFFHVFGKAPYEFRMGMSRAQVVFEHPILYGVYVATFCAPVYMVARAQGRSPLKSLIYVSPVLAATFFSLSAGAFLGVILQIMFITWAFMFRKVASRWLILTALVALAYVVVSLLSNRTPFEVFISYLTFNSSTSYMRVLIFTFGMENVWAKPLFGMGLGTWVRPSWMYSSSVDNFWLVMAMRYGIPGFVFIALAFFFVFVTMMRAKLASAAAGLYRNGHVFSLIGLAIALCTVHLWTATFVFMMFMLGAGLWVADAPQSAAKDGKAGAGGLSPDRGSGGVSRASRASDRNRQPVSRRPSETPAAE